MPEKPEPAATAPPPALTPRKKLLFGCMAAALFLLVFGVIEGGLRLAGVAADTSWQDPYLSFLGDNPLFERHGDEWRTSPRRRLFNRQSFPAAKAPRNFRFFAIGGSTTYGYPRGADAAYPHFLESELERRHAGIAVESVNAGGICYASYREVKLVEEALRHAPDLIVVISGQNEFIEPRFYEEYVKASPAMLRLRFALNRLRIYALAKRLVLGAAGGLAKARAGKEAEGLEEARLPREFKQERYIVRDERERELTLFAYERNLDRMAEAAARAGVPILFMTCPANLRDFRPFVSEFAPGTSDAQKAQWRAAFEAGTRELDAKRPLEALRRFAEAEAIEARPAVLHFLRGKALDALARYPEAKRAYVEARDRDAFPHRAPTAFNEAVVRVARRHDALLVDVMALFERLAPQGIPGNDWFVDQSHPSVEGHRQMAKALAEAIDKAKVVESRIEK